MRSISRENQHDDGYSKVPSGSSGAVDIFCNSPSPKRTIIDFGGGAIWSGGGRKGGIKVLFIVQSISRESRRKEGDPQVPSAFVRGGRYILQLTKSKSDKN